MGFGASDAVYLFVTTHKVSQQGRSTEYVRLATLCKAYLRIPAHSRLQQGLHGVAHASIFFPLIGRTE